MCILSRYYDKYNRAIFPHHRPPGKKEAELSTGAEDDDQGVTVYLPKTEAETEEFVGLLVAHTQLRTVFRRKVEVEGKLSTLGVDD